MLRRQKVEWRRTGGPSQDRRPKVVVVSEPPEGTSDAPVPPYCTLPPRLGLTTTIFAAYTNRPSGPATRTYQREA